MNTPKPKILVIDNEPEFYKGLEWIWDNPFKKYNCIPDFNKPNLLQGFDAILFDLDYSNESNYEEGLAVLPSIIQAAEKTPVIIVSSDTRLQSYQNAINNGASNYLLKEDFDNKPWKKAIVNTIDCYHFREYEESFICNSKALNNWVRKSRNLSNYHSLPLLISGKAGNGKSIFAQNMCKFYPNSTPVSLSTIDFTYLSPYIADRFQKLIKGDNREFKIWLFKNIDGATLNQQQKILDLLESNNVRREIDRYIFTSAKDLDEEVGKGRFNQALYDHISLIHINIPPLCDRKEDIIPLINYFLCRANCCPKCSPFFGKNVDQTIEVDVREELQRYDWPNEIRELRSVVQTMVWKATRENKDKIDLACLPERFKKAGHLIENSAISLPLWSKQQNEAYHKLVEIEKSLINSGNNNSSITQHTHLSMDKIEEQVEKSFRLYPELKDTRVFPTIIRKFKL